jgi:hypothetical protein
MKRGLFGDDDEVNEIRQTFPHRWLLLEALKAHSDAGKRVVEELAVLDSFSDPIAAWRRYKDLHHRLRDREFYVIHTDREELDITELVMMPLRPSRPEGAQA